MQSSLRITVTSPNKAFNHTALGENTVKIGRSLKCDFSIPLEDLSREHCLIELAEEALFITDLGSANGVWIDRERIPPHTKVQIFGESAVVLSNLYQMNIAQMEIKTKSDINVSMSSAPKEVNRDIQTLTFQLDIPDEKDKLFNKGPGSIIGKKKLLKSGEKIEKEHGANFEGAKMIVGFLIVAGAVLFHFVFQN